MIIALIVAIWLVCAAISCFIFRYTFKTYAIWTHADSLIIVIFSVIFGPIAFLISLLVLCLMFLSYSDGWFSKDSKW